MENSFNLKEQSSAKLSALRASIATSTMLMANNPVFNGHQNSDAWLFRDDIGAPNGIKGYEE